MGWFDRKTPQRDAKPTVSKSDPSRDPRDVICAFIFERSKGRVTASNLSDTADLLDAGYVDSIGVAELIAHLEDQFGVRIPEREIVGRLNNVAALSKHIREGMT